MKALCCGCASQDGLGYGDEHVGVDVSSTPPEHWAPLDLCNMIKSKTF